MGCKSHIENVIKSIKIFPERPQDDQNDPRQPPGRPTGRPKTPENARGRPRQPKVISRVHPGVAKQVPNGTQNRFKTGSETVPKIDGKITCPKTDTYMNNSRKSHPKSNLRPHPAIEIGPASPPTWWSSHRVQVIDDDVACFCVRIM